MYGEQIVPIRSHSLDIVRDPRVGQRERIARLEGELRSVESRYVMASRGIDFWSLVLWGGGAIAVTEYSSIISQVAAPAARAVVQSKLREK